MNLQLVFIVQANKNNYYDDECFSHSHSVSIICVKLSVGVLMDILYLCIFRRILQQLGTSTINFYVLYLLYSSAIEEVSGGTKD